MKIQSILTAALGALLATTVLHATDYAVASDGTAGRSVNAAIGGGRLINKWTFCAWVFITEGGSYAATDSPVALLTSQESPPSGVSAEILLTDNGGTQRLEIGRSNYYYGIQSTGAVPLNQWVHVAVTVSSTNFVSYYVNGVSAGTGDYTGMDTTIGGTAASGAGLIRLMGNGVARKFKGRMDDVQIRGVVLTQPEIQALMSAPPPADQASLAAWYRFDEGTGTTTVNADTGPPLAPEATLTGGVTWVDGASSRFVVTNSADSGEGSLRQAFAYAVSSPGADTITFAPGIGTLAPATEFAVTDPGGVTLDATALPNMIRIQHEYLPYPIFNVAGGASLTLRNIALDGRFTESPAGLIVNSGTTTMANCSFRGHLSSSAGAIDNRGTMILSACDVVSNSSAYAGAIHNRGTMTLTGCALSGNQSSSYNPGAIFNTGPLTLTNCSLTGNSSALGFAGAVYNTSNLLLTHCTLSGNSAEYGGAIANNWPGATVTLKNSIVAGNSAPPGHGADIYNGEGTVTRTGVNIVQSLVNGAGASDNGTAALTANPLLGSLADNGGPTLSMALLPGSPALDAVPEAFIVAGVATDQRGFLRNRDGNAVTGARPDLGAWEAQTPPAPGLEQIVVTTTADENDATGTAGTGISLREAIRGAASGRTIIFDPMVFTAAAHTIIMDAAKGEMRLTGSRIIDASSLAGGVTVDGGPGQNRIFSVAPPGDSDLRGLTLTNAGTYTDLGGAIFNDGTLTLSHCILSGNVADSAGAIFNRGTLSLTHCTLSDNYAGFAHGGGIFNYSGSLTLTHCTFSGNLAARNGGAIENLAALAVTHCTFSGNQAGEFGGAIRNYEATLALMHCTLSENSAPSGGGISNDGSVAPSSITLTNSIVARNTALGDGADIHNSGTITRAGANVIQALTNFYGGTDSGTAAINAAPLLSPLANNGGPTSTMALQTGSPALDAVPAGSVIPGLTTDQRGFSRLRDGNATAGALPDIGAYEAQTAPALGSEQIVVTTAMDENDPAGTLGGGVSLREAVRDAAPGSGITFDPSVFTAGAHTIILDPAKGEIRLTKNAVIDAIVVASGVTIGGGSGTNRIFSVLSGTSLTLRGLTLTGGRGDFGGAVRNDGTLQLARCTLAGNTASIHGGAIWNQGPLTLTHCTLSGNFTTPGSGGAIANSGVAPVTLTHSTLAGNSAFFGGAIYNINGTLNLTNSIVAGNSATSPNGADIFNFAGTVTRTGANIIQTLTNDTGTDSGPAAIAAAPLLAPLSSYGGPTPTMALRAGSPARNAAVDSGTTADQRGFPIIGTADIGAYEAGTFINCPVYVMESLPATATAAQLAPSFDFDGDGATNQDEWNALTDPANPASVFRITGVLRSDGMLLMTFPSAMGRKYTLWSSDALGTWTNTGLPVITGNGSDRIFTLPFPGAGIVRRFYRVDVSL